MANKEVAVGKRIRMNKMQQQMLGAVLLTSIVVGACAVLAIFFIKYIVFNSKVITEKDTAIVTYEKSLKSADSLKNNVMNQLAENQELESVGRESLTDCFTAEGKKIDFSKAYDEAVEKDDAEGQAYQLSMLKMCSALRVIPDALPAFENEEALMSSLNQIFILSGWEPESLSPSGTVTTGEIDGVGVIPVSLSVQSSVPQTMKVLTNIEKSIRTFDISAASVEWSGDQLSLQAQASAYYLEESGLKEKTETVYASKNAKKAAKNGSKE